jgi:peptide/nickel transport system permease protein
MTRFVVVRLASMGPSFALMTWVSYLAAHLAPGEPLRFSDEANVAPVLDASGRESSLMVGYLHWLAGAVRLDFGRSVVDHQPVMGKMQEALAHTVVVSSGALLLALGLSVTVGMAIAVRPQKRLSRWVGSALVLASGVPSYWVAVLALLFLATPRGLEVFRLEGLGGHLVLPVCCLAWPFAAQLARFVVDAASRLFTSNMVRALRARGVTERRILLRHVLPNTLTSLLSVVSLELPALFFGSVVIERVFSIRGMGLLAFEAIGHRDATVVLGVASVMAVLTMVSTFAADVLVYLIDPRLRVTVNVR